MTADVLRICDDEDVVLMSSDFKELKQDISDIKRAVEAINISIAQQQSDQGYVKQEIDRAFSDVKELEKKVHVLEATSNRNAWIAKLVYGLVAAIVIGSIVAVTGIK